MICDNNKLLSMMALNKLLKKYTKKTSETISVCSVDTPVGKICGAADNDFLYVVTFEDSKNFDKTFQALYEKYACGFVEDKNEILKQLEQQLSDYFEGNLKKFDLPIKTFGSEFQEMVWQHLLGLPYSSTQTYGELAKAMGRPASHARAVGAACGANTHVIIIPCHRLIATGSKGGFSCGMDRKEFLLEHERKYSQC